MEWTEQLAIGNELVDGQHRELLARFNHLLDACRRQEGKETLEEMLIFLEEYTRTHFSAEEALMARSGYPDRDRHRVMHREFESRQEELRRTLADRGPSLAVIVETNQALLRWIVGHIKTEDVKLGRFLR